MGLEDGAEEEEGRKVEVGGEVLVECVATANSVSARVSSLLRFPSSTTVRSSGDQNGCCSQKVLKEMDRVT